MSLPITRRELLQILGGGAMALLTGCQALSRKKQSLSSAQWYRGNLHMHTYWSDGRAFPEQAIDIYKKLGYDFISLTEHNIFADNPQAWKTVEEEESGWPPDVTRPIFERYLKDYPSEIETKEKNGKTLVRLKSFEELRERSEEAEKFLLMPGVEITQVNDGINVHLNYLNLPDVVPFVKGGPLSKKLKNSSLSESELIALNLKEVAAMSETMQRPSLLMLNHPQWRYWDIQPQHLIENPSLRFFEVANGGSSFPPHPDAKTVTLDSFWDTVNAFRAEKGAPLLYGLGSDDTHYYINREPNKRMADAWIMVRAEKLTTEALLSAMDAGDFYTTSGVLLEEVDFDKKRRKLQVKVQARPGEDYRIRFITTKRGFDQTVRMVDVPPQKGHHVSSIPVYSPEIGQTVKIVEGHEASYTMAPDDLYVRAKIESSTPSLYKLHFHPDFQVAWTQPHA